MIGYHYTSLRSWKRIEKQGLVPHELSDYLHNQLILASAKHDYRTKAVWVWQEKPVGKNHAGNLIRVLAIHNSLDVIMLEVEYNLVDVYCPKPFGNFYLPHEGSIGSFVYHKRAQAHLVTKTIPPNKIKVLQQINIAKALHN